MNVIDKIPFNPEHRWEIIKVGVMFHVTVIDGITEQKVVLAVDDTLSTALCIAYNRITMEGPDD